MKNMKYKKWRESETAAKIDDALCVYVCVESWRSIETGNAFIGAIFHHLHNR